MVVFLRSNSGSEQIQRIELHSAAWMLTFAVNVSIVRDRRRKAAKEEALLQAPPALVMDTNVFVDIHSCSDVVDDFDRIHATKGNAAADDPAVTYRIARARESLLLAMYLHKTKSTSLSLRGEAIDILLRRSPPAARGGTSIKSDYTMLFARFVRDYLLRDWNALVTDEHGSVRSSAADRAHIALAQARSVPIVTNEGYLPDGTFDERALIRREGKAAGIDVYAPREFLAGKINEDDLIEDFLQRFADRVPMYLARRGKQDQMHRVLGLIFGIFRFVLRGEVEGRSTPVRVKLT